MSRLFAALLIALCAASARADSIYVGAEGTLRLTNNGQIWVDSGGTWFLVSTTLQDMQRFARAMNNQKVLVQGRMNVEQRSDLGRAVVVIRPDRMMAAQNTYGNGLVGVSRGEYYNNSAVIEGPNFRGLAGAAGAYPQAGTPSTGFNVSYPQPGNSTFRNNAAFQPGGLSGARTVR